MWLIIDTTESGFVHLYYSVGDTWHVVTTSVTDSLQVLACIHSLLESKKCSLQDVRGVGIVQAKGAFTATRVAATIANTLSYAQQIPAIGVRAKPVDPPTVLFAGLVGSCFVTPEYSAPPSIGGSRA